MVLVFYFDRVLWVVFKKGSCEVLDNFFWSYYFLFYYYGLKIYGDLMLIEDSL